MKLLSESIEEVELITEANSAGGKDYFIHGIFLQGDIKNRNGRRYPVDTLDREVSRYVTEMVKEKRAFGELGHPAGPAINLDRVSHIITELTKDRSDYIGKAKLINTPMGSIAKGILESGGKIGVSSRGLGTLKPTSEGIMEVQSDFRIATAADIVHDPSAPNAFVQGIMEGIEYFIDPITGTFVEEKVHNTKKLILKISRRQLEESKLQLFKNFLNDVAKI